jgi:outer membrane protein assembly factor BamB
MVYAGLADGYLVAMDIERGREAWKSFTQQSEQMSDVDSTPVLDNDTIYVSGYDGALYAMKKQDGELLWKFEKGSITKVQPDGDRLFFSSDSGFIYCLDAKTGKEIWKKDLRDLDAKRSATKSYHRKLRVPTGPLLFENFLITATSTGYFYVLSPDTGKVLWKYMPGYGVSSEIISYKKGVFFLTNSAMLYKLQLSKYPKSEF